MHASPLYSNTEKAVPPRGNRPRNRQLNKHGFARRLSGVDPCKDKKIRKKAAREIADCRGKRRHRRAGGRYVMGGSKRLQHTGFPPLQNLGLLYPRSLRLSTLIFRDYPTARINATPRRQQGTAGEVFSAPALLLQAISGTLFSEIRRRGTFFYSVANKGGICYTSAKDRR
jgi:hypothetical protein